MKLKSANSLRREWIVYPLFVAFALSVRAEIATIVITPANPSLHVGEMQLFTAQGFDHNGIPHPITDPHWESDGTSGAITPDPQNPTQCQYRATQPGPGYVTCYAGPPENDPVHGSTDITVTGEAPPVDRIDVTPKIVSLHVGEMQLFTARGFDANTNEVPISPEWTTTGGGTIETNGRYTAITPGNYEVVAGAVGSTVKGTATVSVVELTRIAVTPKIVSLHVGEMQLFTARGFDANTNEVPISPEWTTTGGGMIETNGRYTAITPGNYEVVAGAVGSTVKGTGTVTAVSIPITNVTVTPPCSVAFPSYTTTVYTLQSRASLTTGSWTNVPGAGPTQGTGGGDGSLGYERAACGNPLLPRSIHRHSMKKQTMPNKMNADYCR